MASESPPASAASIKVLRHSVTEVEIRPDDLIAEKGGLFIPFENLTPDDVAKLMTHLATYDVKPVACGEIIGVIPSVPPSDRKK